MLISKLLIKKNIFSTLPLIAVLLTTMVIIFRQQEFRTDAASSAIETESGTLSGNVSKGTESSAANGQYVQFGTASNPITPQASSPAPTNSGINGGYRVQGNTFIDSNNRPHVFRGVDRPSLEWDANGINISTADFQKMRTWKANVVRLATCDVFWVKNTNGYQSRLKTTIEQIKANNMDVIIDLHRSHPQSADCSSQQKMPDRTNSTIFWRDMATIYKNDGRILFELYNEPRDVSCDVWKNGGSVDNWQAAGMQELVTIIRTQGAQNIVLVGGLDWAFDINRCYTTHKITGTNIAYATHPYKCDNCGGKDDVNDWDEKVAPVALTSPVIMTEFGNFSSSQPTDCDDTFDRALITWAENKGISWTAWGWWAGSCSFPSLIKDWDGTPNAPGRVVQEFLSKNP